MPLPFFKKKLKEKIPSSAEKETQEIETRKPVRPKAEKAELPRTTSLVVERPHVTEKATRLAEVNQYSFRVSPRANKIEVKKAIEDIYGVDVTSVRMIHIPPKKRRRGRIEGWRKGYKKAIVRIKEGQKIEVLPR